MRVWLSGIAVLVIAAALAWWLRAPSLPPPPEEARWPAGFGAPPTAPLSGDASRRRVAGRVVDELGAPISTATVRLYAHAFAVETATCEACSERARRCRFPTTAQHLAEALRSGALTAPPIISQQPVNPDGTFIFEEAPPGAVVWAGDDAREGALRDADDAELHIVLRPSPEFVVTLVGDAEQPRSDGWLTVFEPVLGAQRRLSADGEGRVRVRTADPLVWVYAEAPGALPRGQSLPQDLTLRLEAPRALIVKTVRDGAAIDADIELELLGHHFTRRSSHGEARFEGLPPEAVALSARAGTLVSGAHALALAAPETVEVVELFAAGALSVALETPEGEPVNAGTVSLHSTISDASHAIEPGALVRFEHLPEGDFTLVIAAEGFVQEEQRLVIAGGRETRLEVTLRRPLVITGTIVDAQGAPVEEAELSVVDENGEEIVQSASHLVSEGFVQEVPHAGRFTLRAADAALGMGEARVSVPGPPVRVQLKPGGVLEVRARTPDGDFSAELRVTPVDGWRRVYLAPTRDGGWARSVSLRTGDYVLRGKPWGYLPINRTVHVTEGQTTRVELTADPGASITGRVLLHDGAPLRNDRVSADSSRGRTAVITGDDGRFELRGVPPGPLTLLSCDTGTTPPTSFPFTAPATGVELRCPEPRWSHGRVIDAQGRPVPRFRANDREISASDGRFEVPWVGQLVVSAEGYATVSRDDAGVEVGDVVLRSTPMIEGEVVDPEGAPVSGASVHLGSHADGVRSDARGHFKLEVYGETGVELRASFGGLSGTARATPGTPARIVLSPAARVIGRIVDRQGQGVVATVRADGPGGERELRSDAQGHFSGELPTGVWVFTSRVIDGMRAIEVRAPETRVELGRSASSCGLTVEAPGRRLAAGWLLPSKPAVLNVEPEVQPNTMVALAQQNRLVFSGVECGAYSVAVGFLPENVSPGSFEFLDALKPSYATELITLRGNDERLVLPAP